MLVTLHKKHTTSFFSTDRRDIEQPKREDKDIIKHNTIVGAASCFICSISGLMRHDFTPPSSNIIKLH